MPINMEPIVKLRDDTGAGILEAKKALEDANGDFEAAKKALLAKASAKAAKKAGRTAGDGLVHAYIHATGKVGSLVNIGCETDFVAKTEDFKRLVHEIALQVCTESYSTVEELLASEYVKDSSKKMLDLINEVTAKVGEKIEVKEFVRFSI